MSKRVLPLLFVLAFFPATANAQTRPLTIRITEVENLSDFPDFDLTTEPDFFMRTTTDCCGVSQTRIIDDDDHLDPPPADWDAVFQVPLGRRFVSVNLHLIDHDPDPEADATGDIDFTGGEGDSTFDFTVDMVTLSFTDEDSNVGNAFAESCTQGEAGDQTAKVCFVVDIGDNPLDSDGDGLRDTWELLGVDLDGNRQLDPDEDLPALGASSTVQDIFVRVDYMDCTVAGGDCPAGNTHSHRFHSAARQAVIDAFAAEGIVLHVDVRTALPHQWFMQLPNGGCVGNPAPCDASFDAIKAANFTPAQLRQIYHYVIFGHLQDPATTSTGCAELPGNDFIVTLGGFQNQIGSVQQQAGTFMHELGHNLNLRHGGDENLTFKPNYPSIMNYWYQLGGLQPTDPDGAGPLAGRLDFSDGTLNPLDETMLNEGQGIGPATDAISFFCPPVFVCESPLPTTPLVAASSRTVQPATATAGPIPWQCEGAGFTPQTVRANPNGDWLDTADVCFGPFSSSLTGKACTSDADCGGASASICSNTTPRGPVGCAVGGDDGCHNPGEAARFCGPGRSCLDLHDFDDWGSLQLAFQGTAEAADGVRSPGEPELDFETYLGVLTPNLALALNAAPAPVLTGTDLIYTASLTNTGPSTAENARISQTLPSQVTFVSCQASGAGSCTGTPAVPAASWPSIGSSGGEQMQVVGTVRCEVPDGTSITSTATAATTTEEGDLSNNAPTAAVFASNPPPVISGLSTSVPTLWSPNHRMVDETVAYTVTDNCGTPVCHLEVASNEPTNGLGDGDAAPDWEILDEHRVRLRAERSGTGSGRTYTISVVCSDSGGGSSAAGVEVNVPLSRRP